MPTWTFFHRLTFIDITFRSPMILPVKPIIFPYSHIKNHDFLVGDFTLSEKYESQLGWLFPIYVKIEFMFQTTKQFSIFHILIRFLMQIHTIHIPLNQCLVALASCAQFLQRRICPEEQPHLSTSYSAGKWWKFKGKDRKIMGNAL